MSIKQIPPEDLKALVMGILFIIAGIAFGFWMHSIGAGIFAFAILFLWGMRP